MTKPNTRLKKIEKLEFHDPDGKLKGWFPNPTAWMGDSLFEVRDKINEIIKLLNNEKE